MINFNLKKILCGIILIAFFAGFFVSGVWVGVNKIAYNVPQPGTIDFSLFWDAYNKLSQNFINPEKIVTGIARHRPINAIKLYSF